MGHTGIRHAILVICTISWGGVGVGVEIEVVLQHKLRETFIIFICNYYYCDKYEPIRFATRNENTLHINSSRENISISLPVSAFCVIQNIIRLLIILFYLYFHFLEHIM